MEHLTQKLGIKVADQLSLEQDVIKNLDDKIRENEAELNKKRADRVLEKINKIEQELAAWKEKLRSAKSNSAKEKIYEKMDKLDDKILLLREEEKAFAKLREAKSAGSNNESVREALIRLGKITPYSNLNNNELSQLYEDTIQQSHNSTISNTEPQGINDGGFSENSFTSDDDTTYVETDQPRKRIVVKDDGDETFYQHRVFLWAKKRFNMDSNAISNNCNNPEDHFFSLQPGTNNIEIEGGLSYPSDLWKNLFEYQRTCQNWLWELHRQKLGGIIGDEMGLGKTVQMIAFLAALHYSKKWKHPAVVVCPATVMRYWLKEFHKWWPPFRVVILHSSGSGLATKVITSENDSSSELSFDEDDSPNVEESHHRVKKLIERVKSLGHILIVTYEGVKVYKKHILGKRWGYVILDEGHKIRNPDADITLTCKQFKSPHRIILSGTPIQNNLNELWSLFDFISPGKLGTLPVFQAEFSVPISMGGYANASSIQVQAAQECAILLKNLIAPYLLRRMKVDVAKDLPEKSEQVLFCRLTEVQKRSYTKFLESDEVEKIFNGKRQVLYGIDILRKICNHPSLLGIESTPQTMDKFEESGKLIVVKSLLTLWKNENNRALIFTQTRQMLDIMEGFIRLLGFSYCRMDGTTPIRLRSTLIDEFNEKSDIFVFLLTTKVGGLGVNLTGADRVIIIDPDWNPSTDLQARERAWRIGQKKTVRIYRLMMAGTIEEKIYHRQIFKQFLTNKILHDPSQHRFFERTDLHDLFALSNFDSENALTADVFPDQHISALETRKRKREQDDTDCLNGVVSSTDMNSSIGPAGSIPKDEDERILQNLFDMAGIQGAVHHDSVFSQSSRHEIEDVNEELDIGKKIANRALQALKESGVERKKFDVSIPTWTGKAGYGGIPGARLEFANNGTSSPRVGQSQSTSSQFVSDQPFLHEKNREGLSISIIDFMRANEGQATSTQIVGHFKLSISPSEVPEFRRLLRGIATFDKSKGGKGGIWRLRNEFKK